MSGWVMVEKEEIDSDDSLKSWVEAAARFVQTLPPKTVRAAKPSQKASRK